MTPILKKPGFDETSPLSYRPIYNLLVISKLFERLVARQLVTYIDANDLLPATQSGFQRGYSTETAIIGVLSDLLNAVDRDDTAVFVLLELSVTFDTVDHEILLKRLRDCGSPSVLTSRYCRGFSHTSLVADSTSAAEVNVLPLLTSSMVCHRGRSLDQYSS